MTADEEITVTNVVPTPMDWEMLAACWYTDGTCEWVIIDRSVEVPL